MQQLKDILNALYPQDDAAAALTGTAETPAGVVAAPTTEGESPAADAPALTDMAETPASEVAEGESQAAAAPALTDMAETASKVAEGESQAAAAPAATDMADTPASEVAAPTEVGIEIGCDNQVEEGVVKLGELPYSKNWPAVLKQCMESYEPEYDYLSCWVNGGGFVIGFTEPWELEHVPAKSQFPLSVFVAADVQEPGDAAKDGWEEPCGSHVDQMDTLPLESNDSTCPGVPKSSFRRQKPMESPQD